MKKILSVILCFTVILSCFVFSVPASAAAGSGTVTIGSMTPNATTRTLQNIGRSINKETLWVTSVTYNINTGAVTIKPKKAPQQYTIYYKANYKNGVATAPTGEQDLSTWTTDPSGLMNVKYYAIVVTPDGAVSSAYGPITSPTGYVVTFRDGMGNNAISNSLPVREIIEKDTKLFLYGTDSEFKYNKECVENAGGKIIDMRQYAPTATTPYYEFKGWSTGMYGLTNVTYTLTKDTTLYTQYSLATSSGQCGPNAYWSVYERNVDSFELIIKGSGVTSCYEEQDVPWKVFAPYITKVTITEGVTEIGKYTFAGLSKLKEVVIDHDMNTIDEYAFANCPELESLKALNLNSIKSNAFSGDKKLQIYSYANNSKTITVTHDIETDAFKNCVGLTELEFISAPGTVYANAFRGCSSLVLSAEKNIADGFSPTSLANKPWGAKSFKVAYTINFVVDGELIIANESHKNCSNAEYCSDDTMTLESRTSGDSTYTYYIDGNKVSGRETIYHAIGTSDMGCTNAQSIEIKEVIETKAVDKKEDYYGSNKQSVTISVSDGYQDASGEIAGQHLMTLDEYNKLSASERTQYVSKAVEISLPPHDSGGILLEGELPEGLLIYDRGTYYHKWVVNGKTVTQACSHAKGVTDSEGKAMTYGKQLASGDYFRNSGDSGATIKYCTGGCSACKYTVAYEAKAYTSYKTTTIENPNTVYQCCGHCQGHQAEISSIKAYEGDTISLIGKLPDAPGYDIKGWSLDGYTVIPNDELPTKMPGENRTYYLVFSGSFEEPGVPGSSGGFDPGGDQPVTPSTAKLTVRIYDESNNCALIKTIVKEYSNNTTITTDDIINLVKDAGYDTSGIKPEADIAGDVFPKTVEAGNSYSISVYISTASSVTEPTTQPNTEPSTEPNTDPQTAEVQFYVIRKETQDVAGSTKLNLQANKQYSRNDILNLVKNVAPDRDIMSDQTSFDSDNAPPFTFAANQKYVINIYAPNAEEQTTEPVTEPETEDQWKLIFVFSVDNNEEAFRSETLTFEEKPTQLSAYLDPYIKEFYHYQEYDLDIPHAEDYFIEGNTYNLDFGKVYSYICNYNWNISESPATKTITYRSRLIVNSFGWRNILYIYNDPSSSQHIETQQFNFVSSEECTEDLVRSGNVFKRYFNNNNLDPDEYELIYVSGPEIPFTPQPGTITETHFKVMRKDRNKVKWNVNYYDESTGEELFWLNSSFTYNEPQLFTAEQKNEAFINAILNRGEDPDNYNLIYIDGPEAPFMPEAGQTYTSNYYIASSKDESKNYSEVVVTIKDTSTGKKTTRSLYSGYDEYTLTEANLETQAASIYNLDEYDISFEQRVPPLQVEKGKKYYSTVLLTPKGASSYQPSTVNISVSQDGTVIDTVLITYEEFDEEIILTKNDVISAVAAKGYDTTDIAVEGSGIVLPWTVQPGHTYSVKATLKDTGTVTVNKIQVEVRVYDYETFDLVDTIIVEYDEGEKIERAEILTAAGNKGINVKGSVLSGYSIGKAVKKGYNKPYRVGLFVMPEQ